MKHDYQNPDYAKFEFELRSLPPIEGKEGRVDQIVREIPLFLSIASANSIPSANEIPLLQSDKELKKAIKRCVIARASLNTLHLTSLNRISEFLPLNSGAHPLSIQHDLRIIIEAADRAITAQNLSLASKNHLAGRPRSQFQRDLVNYLASIYIELTERDKAARNVSDLGEENGKFLDFVEKSFIALGVSGSAKSQVAQRSAKMYKKSEKE